LIEVLKHIFVFIRIFRFLVKKAEEERPDAVVLIDYPGFNIRFAKQMYKRKIPVIWYVSPQVWAWRKSNIPKLATYCSKMMVIFPFEPETYQGTGLDVKFVGHPLLEIVKDRLDPEIKRDEKYVLLLPGSRGHEVQRLLRPMLETACKLFQKDPELKFAISAPRQKIFDQVKEIVDEFKNSKKEDAPDFELSCGDTQKWMQKAGTGLAASGTVTVECAISGLPLVVVYKLNPVTFMLARCVITLFRGFFTMVNIIANKTVYEEFLQSEVEPATLSEAMKKILPGGSRRDEVIKGIQEVSDALSSGERKASANAARECVEFIQRDEVK
jgi:lipid-A-disaccharide synthase